MDRRARRSFLYALREQPAHHIIALRRIGHEVASLGVGRRALQHRVGIHTLIADAQFIDFASQADVFDTAPTGHTMRLIELPMDWSQQIDVKVFASVDTTAADDVAKQRFGDVIEMMRDPARSALPCRWCECRFWRMK